eukprot:SM000051S17593  [mRNA]  locus=s51:539309:539876:+ [translate_table: standard]
MGLPAAYLSLLRRRVSALFVALVPCTRKLGELLVGGRRTSFLASSIIHASISDLPPFSGKAAITESAALPATCNSPACWSCISPRLTASVVVVWLLSIACQICMCSLGDISVPLSQLIIYLKGHL